MDNFTSQVEVSCRVSLSVHSYSDNLHFHTTLATGSPDIKLWNHQSFVLKILNAILIYSDINISFVFISNNLTFALTSGFLNLFASFFFLPNSDLIELLQIGTYVRVFGLFDLGTLIF